MSSWLPYDSIVDLIRGHHHNGFTGLLTGVSDEQHSFQIGFHEGEVVLLTYRILKGARALEKLAQIDRAKITEHRTNEVPATQIELPDTSSILSRLTIHSGDDTLNTAITIPDQTDYSAPVAGTAAPQAPAATHALPNNKQLNAIKTAAIHHFGPIGAMVCEEHLSSPNLRSMDLRSLVRRIAEDVGASEEDTQAFFRSIG